MLTSCYELSLLEQHRSAAIMVCGCCAGLDGVGAAAGSHHILVCWADWVGGRDFGWHAGGNFLKMSFMCRKCSLAMLLVQLLSWFTIRIYFLYLLSCLRGSPNILLHTGRVGRYSFSNISINFGGLSLSACVKDIPLPIILAHHFLKGDFWHWNNSSSSVRWLGFTA